MTTKNAYNIWASTYDSDPNKTRDLELIAGRKVLAKADFSSVLELGCGTGKNTRWLAKKAIKITAVDFSEGMLNVAKQKINNSKVKFQPADITKPWDLKKATLIISSLILEHINDIDFIFQQAAKHLKTKGCFYVCELHPYKQLEGSRATFKRADQTIKLEYFVHHISDFFSAAIKGNMKCIDIEEWFDDQNRSATPRLISFLFQKK